MLKRNKSILITIAAIIVLLLFFLPVNASAESFTIELNSINFPDENFKKAIEEQYPNYMKDAILTKDELDKISSLDVSMYAIQNLKGIEFFTNLKYLNASVNNLKELDLRENAKLRTLDLSNNQLLHSLYLPNSIENLYLDFNSDLRNLDISNLTELKILSAEDVPFKQVQLENLTQLILLNLYNTGLTKIDVSKNINLEYLNVASNNLTTLDVSNNAELVTLRAENNSLEKIQLPNSKKANTQVEFYNQNVAEGYEIKWYEDNIFVEKNAKLQMKGQVLISKINAKTYSVIYNASGGKGSMSAESVIFGNKVTLKANAFSKTGYRFKGWSTNSNGTVKYANAVTIEIKDYPKNGKFNLYAVWEPIKYSIVFDSNGGNGQMNEMSNLAYGEYYKLNKNTYIKEGYTFKGWSKSKNSGTINYFDNASISNLTSNDNGIVRLYAVWQKKTYTITINANGGSLNSSQKTTVEHGSKISIKDPSRTDHTFLGWFDSKTNEKFDFSKGIEASTTLVAKWRFIKKDFNIKAQDSKVTYNGKAQSISPSNVPSGSTIEYRTSKNGKWSTAKPTRTSVGTTTVYYRITNDKYNTIEGSSKIIINAKQVKNLSISNISNKTYTGKPIKPSVTVKDGKNTLKSGTDYSVSYGANKNTGKAYIKITGKGNYSGTITKYFYIIPKAPSITVSSAKRSMTISAKATGASGYEFAYSTSKNGKYKTVTTSSQKRKITKLVSRKKYYVKVRAYKIIDGKKVYSSYSTIKVIKVK